MWKIQVILKVNQKWLPSFDWPAAMPFMYGDFWLGRIECKVSGVFLVFVQERSPFTFTLLSIGPENWNFP